MKFDPAASCRFFTAEDACRLALQAYYAAAAAIQPPPGEPWEVDGQPYATTGDFADEFIMGLAPRLGLLALDRLGSFDPPEDRGNPWERARLLEPEKMAPVIAARETQNADAEELFSGRELHGLPPGDNALHNADAART
jgi:hypothetical protein